MSSQAKKTRGEIIREAQGAGPRYQLRTVVAKNNSNHVCVGTEQLGKWRPGQGGWDCVHPTSPHEDTHCFVFRNDERGEMQVVPIGAIANHYWIEVK